MRSTATAARPAAVAGAKIVSAAGSFSRIESPLLTQALAAGGFSLTTTSVPSSARMAVMQASARESAWNRISPRG
jgi:hypothetical protein